MTIDNKLLHLTFLILKTENKQLILIGNETIVKLKQQEIELHSLIKEFPKAGI